ncbi:hypothetical protein TanjilG_23461 [Lupinus angustifolius]|uniref:Nucleolar protein 58 n=2 Tax=Lupinus angustifolius TaxID=3871 RepID=A0A4P1R991_LUPAN|nr:hypothetical protein TanjilG_23461 [Lupinus angustifolius]
MLVLFETPAGFALFKVLNEGKLSKVEDLGKDFSTADSAKQIVKLKAFSKFENTSEALEAATLLIEGKASKGLRKFLRVHCENETLAVADSKLGNMIKEKLKIDCLHNNAVMELIRGVRNHLAELISGLAVQDMAPMSLGLSHSLSRFKLKFSADKVDTMIVQAIGLLDDLDKELNTYAMRVREWYGWHFPELTKIIQDNIHYAKSVKLMGDRINAAALDFSEILQEEVEAAVKEASVISMGTEIGELDLANIRELCDQVLSLSEYRAQLFDYLKSRMNTIAPNLTALVGELVGARLIAHGGSLMNLAKQPGSTVQILGAEKALFRALKTKHATPKYGLIYHASLIGQAAPKLKGKISRSLAAKAALAIRCDALGEPQDNSLGLESRLKLEARLRNLEGKELGRFAGSAKGKPKIESYDNDRKKGSGGLITPAKTYNASADSVIGQLSKSAIDEDTPELAITDKKKEKKEKKEKKKKEEKNEEDATLQPDGDAGEEPEHDVVKKEKKKKKNSADDDDNLDAGEKKKKRKKHADQEESPELPIKKKGKTKKNDSEEIHLCFCTMFILTIPRKPHFHPSPQHSYNVFFCHFPAKSLSSLRFLTLMITSQDHSDFQSLERRSLTTCSSLIGKIGKSFGRLKKLKKMYLNPSGGWFQQLPAFKNLKILSDKFHHLIYPATTLSEESVIEMWVRSKLNWRAIKGVEHN